MSPKSITTSLYLLLVTVSMLALGLALERWDLFHALKTEVQRKSIPDSILRLGRTGKVARLFAYKTRIGVELEGIGEGLSPEELPSSTIVDPSTVEAGLPVISIVIKPEDLYHPDSGLIANPLKRGMRWERPAFMSYFENGRLLFATILGFRVHGGKSRKSAKKSFRLLFRNIYGAKQFTERILFDGRGDPIRSIILHNDMRTSVRNGVQEHWRFVNPLAYDIARQAGCLASETKPVQFYLNGEYQGPYVLTEHLSKNYLRTYFGHDDFIFARTRRDKGSKIFKMGNRQVYEDFITWPERSNSPFTMQEVANKVDLENLSLWFISILYSGTTDPFQGPLLLDQTKPDAKWFWINWDMDQSFMDWRNEVEHPWEIDTFDDVLNNRWRKHRSIILNRLRKESPEYREYFQKLFTEVMNHKLTKSFLNSRIDFYENAAINLGVDDRQFINNFRQYVKHRHRVLMEQIQNYFNTGPFYPCRISSNRPIRFEIDGYPTEGQYEGWYFKNMPLTVTLLGSKRKEFSHWLINSQVLRTGEMALRLIIKGPTDIDAVFVDN